MKRLAQCILVTVLMISETASANDLYAGDRVYALFGRHESAAKVYTGNVLFPGRSSSSIQFENCRPACLKWVENAVLFTSEKDAKNMARKLDENHTSISEGFGYFGLIVGALIIADSIDPPKQKPSTIVKTRPSENYFKSGSISKIFHEGYPYYVDGSFEYGDKLVGLIVSQPNAVTLEGAGKRQDDLFEIENMTSEEKRVLETKLLAGNIFKTPSDHLGMFEFNIDTKRAFVSDISSFSANEVVLMGEAGGHQYFAKVNERGEPLFIKKFDQPGLDFLKILALNTEAQEFVLVSSLREPKSIEAPEKPRVLSLSRYDAEGKIVWESVPFSGSHYVQDIASDSESNVYAIGFDGEKELGFVASINSLGENKWIKYLEPDDIKPKKIQVNDLGDLLVVGYSTKKSKSSLLKLNSLGEIKSRADIGRDTGFRSGTQIDDFVPTTDGGMILGGRTRNSGIPYKEPDDWGYKYNAILVKINGSGKRVWEKTYGGVFDDEIKALTRTPNGEILALGTTESRGVGDEDIWAVTFNEDGGLIRERYFGDERANRLYSSDKLPNGNYIFASRNILTIIEP